MALLHRSLWQYCAASVEIALAKLHTALHHVAGESNYAQFCLGIIRVNNLPAIILAHDEAEVAAAIDKLVHYLQVVLALCGKVIKIGVYDILVIQEERANSRESFDLLMNSLVRYGIDLSPSIYFSLKAGMTTLQCGDIIESALDEAFIALHEAIESSLNVVWFDNASRQVKLYKETLKLATELKLAIEQNRVRVAYQPIIDSKTGDAHSYEALLRIVGDDGVLLSAAPYITVAEDLCFINDLDVLVLQRVFQELCNHDHITLSANVSTVSAWSDKWLSVAKELLYRRPEVASRLIVEITETDIQRDINKIAVFIDAIKALGCKVAIDDFGAGYTSFAQLKLFNVDILKIDGIFIQDLVTNPDSYLFVETLQRFATAFGLQTVAEFVETGAIAKQLIDMNIDFLQGYYFSKPLDYKPWEMV